MSGIQIAGRGKRQIYRRGSGDIVVMFARLHHWRTSHAENAVSRLNAPRGSRLHSVRVMLQERTSVITDRLVLGEALYGYAVDGLGRPLPTEHDLEPLVVGPSVWW